MAEEVKAGVDPQVISEEQLRKAHGHVGDACNPRQPLAHEKLNEALFGRVEEVAEHVHVAAVFNGGDFYPGNCDQPTTRGLGGRFVNAIGRVVIGDREYANA